MARVFTPRYCAACGGQLLAPLAAAGGPPLVCARCGLGSYLDPKLAVATVLFLPDESVVLLRRAQRDQAFGRWILPGGHVDRGEELPSAALREVAEETGLTARVQGLLGVYSYPGNPLVLVVYTALAQPGPLCTSRESLEIRSFGRQDIPWDELGYLSTGQALRQALGLPPGPLAP
ncbi:MAG: NUDIX domain-containing protein [Desulfarculus sp.]|nr:NUDIX domain-containing protein [Desulfarculus sp.]